MSQLQKKMQRIQRREGPGIGFGAAVREQPRAMLLVALAANTAEAKAALGAGADVALIEAPASEVAGQLDGLGAEKTSIGVFSPALNEAGATALAKAGCDFVVSTLEQTESVAFDTERMGHILVANEGMEDNTLRSLASLGLDALYVERAGSGTMLANQLGLVRLASFASTPLLVTIGTSATVSELRVLRDSGVIGVVAPKGTTAEQTKALVEALKAVPAPKKSRREGAEMAIVPATAVARGGGDDDDDDDGDDD